MLRTLGACAFLLAAGFVAADEKKPAPPKGEPVAGKVTLDGVPVTGAVVAFVSQDGKSAVTAEVKDGAYRTAVPVGEYAVAIASVPPKKDKEEKPVPKDPAKFLPVVPPKYGDPKTSGLVAKVAAGKNELNFDLKSK